MEIVSGIIVEIIGVRAEQMFDCLISGNCSAASLFFCWKILEFIIRNSRAINQKY